MSTRLSAGIAQPPLLLATPYCLFSYPTLEFMFVVMASQKEEWHLTVL